MKIGMADLVEICAPCRSDNGEWTLKPFQYNITYRVTGGFTHTISLASLTGIEFVEGSLIR